MVGGLSLGLLAAGVMSPRVGTLIERHGGRPVLEGSSLLLAAGRVGGPADPEALGNSCHWDGRISEHRACDRLVGRAQLAPPSALASTGEGGFQALHGPLAVEVQEIHGDVPRKLNINRPVAVSVSTGLPPTEAGPQVGLGRATVYREMALAGITRTIP